MSAPRLKWARYHQSCFHPSPDAGQGGAAGSALKRERSRRRTGWEVKGMADNKSTKMTALCADVAKRVVAALSARAMWAAILYLLHRDL